MIILLSLLIICVLIRKLSSKKQIIIIYIILLSLAIFKDISVGRDTVAYRQTFYNISNLKFYDIILSDGYMEKGFLIYNKMISYITKKYFIYNLITYSIIIYIFIKFIYLYSKDLFLSFVLFIGYQIYPESLSMLRQTLAMVIVLYGVNRYLKNKKKESLLFFILAIFFHKTSAIFLSIYFFEKINLDNKRIIYSTLFSLVIFIYFFKILEIVLNIFPIYKIYLTKDYRSYTELGIGTILYSIIAFISFIFILKIGKKITNLEKWMLFLNFTLLLFSIRFKILVRVAMYYQMFYLISLPNAIYYSKKTKYKVIIFIFILLYNMCVFYFRRDWNPLFNYKFL